MHTRLARVIILLGWSALLGACAGTPRTGASLDWLVGEWVGTRRDAEDGSEATLAVRVQPLADGPGQIERVEVTGGGKTYIGVAVRVPVAETGQWEMSYVNAARETIARLEGTVQGDRATWRSVTPGRTRESRVEIERGGADAWKRTQWISQDEGKTWRVLFTDAVRRKR